MGITLAEEIMLLCLDEESGVPRQRQAAGWAAAGGILLELVMAERVSVSGIYLELGDTTPTGDPLLDSRIVLIGAWLRGRSKGRVTDWLTKDHTKVVDAALEGLTARGLVVAQARQSLGLFPQRRYAQADGAVERALRQRLSAAVLGDAEPDERTAGLIALLHSAGLHQLAFPGRAPGTVAPRMAETAAGQWAAEGVRAAVRDVQAAMATVAAATALTLAPPGD
ncbi:GPP34 family phosphoprotein [Streptomyces sp. NPDC005409]|uniref:GOLPH3/VPS74 family protein n=1 Tax=Streptomyces sp. NPDC005409 TaxID=3155342 RepID=UPI00345196A7